LVFGARSQSRLTASCGQRSVLEDCAARPDGKDIAGPAAPDAQEGLCGSRGHGRPGGAVEVDDRAGRTDGEDVAPSAATRGEKGGQNTRSRGAPTKEPHHFGAGSTKIDHSSSYFRMNSRSPMNSRLASRLPSIKWWMR